MAHIAVEFPFNPFAHETTDLPLAYGPFCVATTGAWQRTSTPDDVNGVRLGAGRRLASNHDVSPVLLALFSLI